MSRTRGLAAGGAPQLGEILVPSSDLREGVDNKKPPLGDRSDPEDYYLSGDSQSEFDDDDDPFGVGSVSRFQLRIPIAHRGSLH